jgi:chaperonin GroES
MENAIMEFKPLGFRVLVERIEETNTTVSGIIIPDSAKEKPSQGKVIAVSDDVRSISEGDTVVFGKYSGSELSLEGNDYIILKVEDVFGIVK